MAVTVRTCVILALALGCRSPRRAARDAAVSPPDTGACGGAVEAEADRMISDVAPRTRGWCTLRDAGAQDGLPVPGPVCDRYRAWATALQTDLQAYAVVSQSSCIPRVVSAAVLRDYCVLQGWIPLTLGGGQSAPELPDPPAVCPPDDGTTPALP